MRKLLLIVLTFLFVLAACGTDTTTDAADTSTPAPTAEDGDEASVLDAFQSVTAACQDRDRDRLQDLVTDELGDQVRDRDRDRLFGPATAEIDLISRTIRIDGDTATVTAVFEVTVDGGTTEVERVWEFERTDDTWVLTEIPDCPFRS